MKTFLIPVFEKNFDHRVTRWLVADGVKVETGQPLVELECEKADLTLSSPVSGILWHRSKVSERVRAGELIGEIESAEKYGPPQPSPPPVESQSIPLTRDKKNAYWTSCDGWILASISGGLDRGINGAVDLCNILMFGDFINHAILTPEELSNSLTKLRQHNIICILEGSFDIDEKWREEIISFVGDISPVVPISRATKWLNTRTFVKETKVEIRITEEEYQSAYDAYRRKTH